MPSIRFYPGGGVRAMADTLALPEQGSKVRASHVEPACWALRVLFHLIRKRVDDDSQWAEFTRSWPCCWRARIFNGPVLGPFATRPEAIEAEIGWLQTNWIMEGLDALQLDAAQKVHGDAETR